MDHEPGVRPSPQQSGAVNAPEGEETKVTPTVTMYTTTWCSDCVAAKRYLDAKGVAYVEVDIEQDDEAAQLVMRLNDGKRSVPTLVSDGAVASLSGFSIRKARDFLAAAGLDQ